MEMHGWLAPVTRKCPAARKLVAHFSRGLCEKCRCRPAYAKAWRFESAALFVCESGQNQRVFTAAGSPHFQNGADSIYRHLIRFERIGQNVGLPPKSQKNLSLHRILKQALTTFLKIFPQKPLQS